MAGDNPELLPFAEAIRDQRKHGGQPAILIGNGFSIDWNRTVFDYLSLFDEADLKNLSLGKAELFDALRTRNFEAVVEYLNVAATLATLYRPTDHQLVDE